MINCKCYIQWLNIGVYWDYVVELFRGGHYGLPGNGRGVLEHIILFCNVLELFVHYVKTRILIRCCCRTNCRVELAA